MAQTEQKIDPYANDPGHWGASLATLGELLFPCLEAAGVRSVAEVGAYAGDLTALLVDWGSAHGSRTIAIDPEPQPELVELAERHPELELVRAPSLEALAEIELPDAVILDGDHNYYTVSHELQAVAQRADAASRPLPLVLMHDVGWPHARRDTYYHPEQIPAEGRQPLAQSPRLYPGITGVHTGGLPYHWSAQTEGGPHNGLLTAAEDFVASREGLRLAVVPAFFGFGVIWQLDLPFSDALAEVLDPWDRNPLLQRLEENRVLHLASSLFQLEEAVRQRESNARKTELIKRLLMSRGFALAQRLSALVHRGAPEFTREELEQLLSDR